MQFKSHCSTQVSSDTAQNLKQFFAKKKPNCKSGKGNLTSLGLFNMRISSFLNKLTAFYCTPQEGGGEEDRGVNARSAAEDV